MRRVAGCTTKIGGVHRALVPFSVGYLPAVADRRDELQVSLAAHNVGAGFSSRDGHVLSISATARAFSDPEMPARVGRWRCGHAAVLPRRTN